MVKKIMLSAIVFAAVFFGYLYFGDDHQRYMAFDHERQVWHAKCDSYVGKPPDSDAAKDCARELAAMMAYAKQQGW